MNTFGAYEPSRRMAIVKDLLKKRPSGGEDRYLMEFETEFEYCTRYNKYRDLFKCNKTYWGYTEHQIHRLDLHSHSRVEAYIREHWYDDRGDWDLSGGEKAGLSRKVNRLWDRISLFSQQIRRGRVAGTYRVQAGDYYNRATLGFVIATDVSHAMQLGQTLFAGFADGRTDFVADYVGFPMTDVLQSKASALGGKLERRLAELKAEHEKKVAKIESEIQAAQMALLIAMDIAEDIDAA